MVGDLRDWPPIRKLFDRTELYKLHGDHLGVSNPWRWWPQIFQVIFQWLSTQTSSNNLSTISKWLGDPPMREPIMKQVVFSQHIFQAVDPWATHLATFPATLRVESHYVRARPEGRWVDPKLSDHDLGKLCERSATWKHICISDKKSRSRTRSIHWRHIAYNL